MMVAALVHKTGMVLGQVEVDRKSNEIPAVRKLSSSLDLAGRTVTLDAMHAQHETARCLLGRRADYVVTAVKDNQQNILEDLKAIDFTDAPWHETVDKGHGRIERRRCAVVDLSAAEWDGYANLHGRCQAMRIERDHEVLKTGERSVEVTWSLTSLGAERAGPEELLALVRNHWHIENRLHYVRDFTYDEDRCRAHVRHLPRNLFCLTNAAIAIVRCDGRFRFLPEANRHYAARAQEALDAILIAAPQRPLHDPAGVTASQSATGRAVERRGGIALPGEPENRALTAPADPMQPPSQARPGPSSAQARPLSVIPPSQP